MVKKSIAAALLVAMVAWAEMALAPMFLMHAGHVHAAREVAEHMAAHDHVMPAGHPCCPGLGKAVETALLDFAATSLPCREQHRCCFLQGPQNPPAPVSSRYRLSQEITAAEIAQLSPAQAESHVSPTTAVVPGPAPGLLGMVLRV
jgi:hypothetical protein